MGLFDKKVKYWRVPSQSWEFCDELLKEHNVLIAGTIGSGKSVLINSVLYSLLSTSPCQNCFYAIDLKHGCELGVYKNVPHCIGFSTDYEDARRCLRVLLDRMEKRYKEMERAGLKKYEGAKVWVVIDELADLVNDKECVRLLVRLMRLGRAARFGVIAATQSPNRRTLVAEMQQNFTCCVGLRCRSAVESRQIIGIANCEKLPEYGECYVWNSHGISKHSVPYTDEEDIETRVDFWEKNNKPVALDD